LNPLSDAKLVDIDVSVDIITLRLCAPSLVVQCIVIGPVCGCVSLFVVVQKYTE